LPLTAVRYAMLLFPDNLRSLWSRALLDKRTGSQLVKKVRAFYGTRRVITAACPYPKPDQSSPSRRILLPEDPPSYYPSIHAWVFQVVSFPQVSPPKPCMYLSSPLMCYMPRLSHYSPFLTYSYYSICNSNTTRQY
jgi:hypothetical protein